MRTGWTLFKLTSFTKYCSYCSLLTCIFKALSSVRQAEVWLYNLAEEVNMNIKVKLEQICEWQAARTGLLHHLLAQKMGLFQHTQGRDIQCCTKVKLHTAMLLYNYACGCYSISYASDGPLVKDSLTTLVYYVAAIAYHNMLWMALL